MTSPSNAVIQASKNATDANANLALQALRQADFLGTTAISDVWIDSKSDVPEIQSDVRAEFRSRLDDLKFGDTEQRPLGMIILGAPGFGKTHLLSMFRKTCSDEKVCFVFVDMTDVHVDFWPTVLLGYITSLQQPFAGYTHQYILMLEQFIAALKPVNGVQKAIEFLAANQNAAKINENADRVITALRRKHPADALQHQNIVRALIAINSLDNSTANIGMTWLQGQEVDPSDQRRIGFSLSKETPRRIVEGLSWLISLYAPTILVFDQLDPIVTQRLAEKNRLAFDPTNSEQLAAATAAIVSIGNGLAAIRDTARRTLAITCCVESTWDQLNELVNQQTKDRFDEPILLRAESAGHTKSLVERRLAIAYRKVGFQPPYSSYPFAESAFTSLGAESPRFVLKKCHQAIRAMLSQKLIREIHSFHEGSSAPQIVIPTKQREDLDIIFRRYQHSAELGDLVDERNEDTIFDKVLESTMSCLVLELDLPDEIDGVIDLDFPGGKSHLPLHVRLRLIYTAEQGRENHFSLRALQRQNSAAFKSRLKSALTCSGIQKNIGFRHLLIVRTVDMPGGTQTQSLIDEVRNAGGQFVRPTEAELRTMLALYKMSNEQIEGFQEWLIASKPVSSISFLKRLIVDTLLQPPTNTRLDEVAQPNVRMAITSPQERPDCPRSTESAPVGKTEKVSQTPFSQPKTVLTSIGAALAESNRAINRTVGVADHMEAITLGRIKTGLNPSDPVSLPIKELSRHTVIMAGAGSGKTVLIRRIVEDLALQGIPSIIIDAQGDLVSIGKPREPSPDWLPGDELRADSLPSRLQPIIFTPGLESGNPIRLNPLPNFAAFRDDPDELTALVRIAISGLESMLISGKGQNQKIASGLLAKAMEDFASTFPVNPSLNSFVDYLKDLPPNVTEGFSNGSKIASKLAELLHTEIIRNPMLQSKGELLDPAVLFGDDRPNRIAARVSVVNLLGLPNDSDKQLFMAQLSDAIYTWVKSNPIKNQRALRGLMIIDEAKIFIPSGRSNPCKENIMRMFAQLRKFGLGMMAATQNITDIENKILGNCAVTVVGKAQGLRNVKSAEDLLTDRGANNAEPAKLPKGQFFFHYADHQPLKVPTRLTAPMCLSQDQPCDPDQIKMLAQESRAILEQERTSR